MAQYWEDWSDESVGSLSAPPTGWTSRWDTAATLSVVSDASAPQGKALRITKTAGDRFFLSFDAVNSDADRATCEVRLLCRLPSTINDGNNIVGAVGRGSGTGTSETGYVANLAGGLDGVVKLNKRLAPYNNATGVTPVITEFVGNASTYQGQLVWLKLVCSGNTISVGFAEGATPGTENLDSTTQTITSAAGWVGVFSFSSGVVVDILAVGVGTNGDAAPIEDPNPVDVTAPTLSSPTSSSTGATSGSGGVTTNEGNGTLYAVATASATAPTKAQVKAGQDHAGAAAVWSGSQAVSSTGAKSVTITGLTHSTTYYIHFMHEDAATNQSDVATSASFTTATVDETAPTLTGATATATGTSAATGSVSTNEANGTLYYLVSTSSTATASAVKAGSSQSVSATGTQNVSATGLTAETSYYIHFLHRDAAGNDSTVVSSAQFTTAAAPVAITIRADYERSSVNLSGSSVSGSGDDAVITIKPRVQESEAYGSQSRWLEPSARVDNVNGFRPTFKFTDYAATAAAGKYHGAPWEATRRPMFSYDRETWHYFSNCTVGTSDITFRHSAAFTSDTVYISRSRQMTVTQVGQWLESISHPAFGPAPSALAFTPTLTSWPAQAFIADEFSPQTNELGETIPATPFYAAFINDTAFSSPKQVAILSAGVHAGEDHSDHIYRRAIAYILGSSADALKLRERYKIYLYPMVNAPGRAGGGMRGSFTQGAGGADDANRNFNRTDSLLQIVNKPKAAMGMDIGSDTFSFGLDFHGAFSTSWGVYSTNATKVEAYRTRINTALGGALTVTNMGETTADSIENWFKLNSSFGVTLEFGDKSPVPDADMQTYVEAMAATINAMADDNLITAYRNPSIPLSLSNTAPAKLQYVLVTSDMGITAAEIESLWGIV